MVTITEAAALAKLSVLPWRVETTYFVQKTKALTSLLSGNENDDFGGRWREVRPKDFVKQFRLILTKERSEKVAKNILLDIAKKNNGKEGMFDMFMQRPNTLKRILEKKTIDGNVVDRLKQQITDWIIYEEEKNESG